MGIWNKLWGKIQEQTKIDSIIYDTERKLIDIPTLLNCTIKDLCELDNSKKEFWMNQIDNNLNQIENALNNLRTTLENNEDNNTKKQLEFEIKNQENNKAKWEQIKEILKNQELQMHYLINYQDRLNSSQFFENDQIINIFDQFHLSPQFGPDDLISARENLENNAYTLPIAERNVIIDQINRNYEILIDPIRLKGYRDILENPDIINVLAKRISELQQKFEAEKESSTTTKLETMENTNPIEPTLKEESIELLWPEEEKIDDTLNVEQPNRNTSTPLNNINKDLLESQKEKLEEQLIPSLINLNKQMKESNNDLLKIAKKSLLKQHQNLLLQNEEYQKIISELEKLKQYV